MTVAELIAELSQLDPTATVIQSRDAEGNGHSPAYTLCAGFYRPYNAYSGEFHQPLDDEGPGQRPVLRGGRVRTAGRGRAGRVSVADELRQTTMPEITYVVGDATDPAGDLP